MKMFEITKYPELDDIAERVSNGICFQIMELTRKYLYAKIGENFKKIGENHG
jgi:hypothetical protein